MRWLIALAVLSGCRSLLGFDELAPTELPQPDASVDGQDDAETSFCFGTVETICLAAAPTMDVDIGLEEMMTISTTSGCLEPTSTTVPDACVVAVRSLTTAGTFRVIGERPLVLLVAGLLEVIETGRIDAASHATEPGPGARDCQAASSPTSGGGGAGGSLVATGGNGGQGGGGAGGQATDGLAMVGGLVGGCTAAAGAGPLRGAGGAGGGGILIIAGSVFVDGAIDASGQGGAGGGGLSSGGGGGGSGGVIVIDAPTIAVRSSGVITAKGGGGGGGSGLDETDPGEDGGDGAATGTNGSAPGGQGGEPGAGQGGNGGTVGGGTSGGGSGARGGGGGGGATGLIRLVTPSLIDDGAVVPGAQ